MAIDLSNYVEVSERIEMFRDRYPEGVYVTEIVELPEAFAGQFIAVRAVAYRTPDDLCPGIDMAWEPVPGKTPYTKDSELQNACTSAIGRAIIAVGAADARRGIASREDIQNRQPEPRPRSGGRKVTPTPQASESHEDAPSAALADVVAGYARDQVAGFFKWSEAERADSYKRHSKALLDGKPVSLEEVDKVVNAMIEEYQARFPGELPI
jgi:hypothetical protein